MHESVRMFVCVCSWWRMPFVLYGGQGQVRSLRVRTRVNVCTYPLNGRFVRPQMIFSFIFRLRWKTSSGLFVGLRAWMYVRAALTPL